MPHTRPLATAVTRRPTLGWAVLAGSATLFAAACLVSPAAAEVALSQSAIERLPAQVAQAAPDQVAAARDTLLRASEALALNDEHSARRLAQAAQAEVAQATRQARAAGQDQGLAELEAALLRLQGRLARS